MMYLEIAEGSIINLMIRCTSFDCMTYDSLEHLFPKTSANDVKVSVLKSTWCLFIFFYAYTHSQTKIYIKL